MFGKNKQNTSEPVDPKEVKIEKEFEASCIEAQKMLKSPGKVEELLVKMDKKLQKIPELGEHMVYLPRMGLMISSYIKKEYTEVPLRTIIAALGAIIYFVAPVDLIPDTLPVVGYIDDAGVVALALRYIESDIDEYMEWRKENGLN